MHVVCIFAGVDCQVSLRTRRYLVGRRIERAGSLSGLQMASGVLSFWYNLGDAFGHLGACDGGLAQSDRCADRRH